MGRAGLWQTPDNRTYFGTPRVTVNLRLRRPETERAGDSEVLLKTRWPVCIFFEFVGLSVPHTAGSSSSRLSRKLAKGVESLDFCRSAEQQAHFFGCQVRLVISEVSNMSKRIFISFAKEDSIYIAMALSIRHATHEVLSSSLTCRCGRRSVEQRSKVPSCRVLVAGPVIVEEFIRLLKNPNRQAAVWGVGVVNRAGVTPNKVAGAAGVVVVDQASFQNEGLFDTAVSVPGQPCPRSHTKHCRESLAVRIAPQDLHLDTGKAGRLPFEAAHVDVV